MEEKLFLQNIAGICIELLKGAKNLAIDIGRLNETMMELDRRARELGMTRKDLYPEGE